MSDDDAATLSANIAAAVMGQGDLDAAIGDLRRLDAAPAGRARLAAGLIEAIVRGGRMPSPAQLSSIDFLLELADANPPATPQWPRFRTAARVASLMRAAMERELADPRAALTELAELETAAGGDPALRPMFDAARMGLGFARTVQDGDAGAMARLPAEMRDFLQRMPAGHPDLDPLRDILTASAGAMSAQQRGGDVLAGVREMQRAAQNLPEGDQLRTIAGETVTAIDALLGSGPVTDERLAELVDLAERPGAGDADRAVYYAQAAAAAVRIGQETDPARIDLGVRLFRETVRLSGPGEPQRPLHLTGLALGLMCRAELTNSLADREEAHAVLEEAREIAGGPHHPQWQMINDMLGELDRMDLRPGYHLQALDGLRGHIWQVLVQPDLAGAAVAVRTAAADAVSIARRCLIANDPASAIQALDAGRGLALFAATETGNVAQRLEQSGEPLLARSWQSAAADGDADKLPSELRREVWTVLSRDTTAAAFLDPPGLDEIRTALATIDADALIYLVPGEGVVPGYAVAAAASGTTSYLALPSLTAEAVPKLEAFLRSVTSRDLSASDEDEQPSEDLCSWAWEAAVGPLVEAYLPRLPAPSSGRPRRIVLVPMGDLARVPWQAARNKDGKYAIELVAISQAASARMLCHSAGLSPVPPSPVGLIVGDPDTRGQAPPLDAARLEAYAIRQAFYPGARYVGRRPNGSVSPSGLGTAEQVKAWLTTSSPAAGTLLHLACHGFVQADDEHRTAYLLLAGGEKLTAEELVALMAESPRRGVDLVVLAACRTGLAITGYDEAYSLGTAFLAGGARSVLSTQWSIPDSSTSALMFLFHLNLRAGRPAWAALRDAQLWMLDPQRSLPPEMPLALVPTSPLNSVVDWAAFVHWGQ